MRAANVEQFAVVTYERHDARLLHDAGGRSVRLAQHPQALGLGEWGDFEGVELGNARI